MKTIDTYTKVVLTVIAAALCLLVFQNFRPVPAAYATEALVPRHAYIPINEDGSITVRLSEQSNDINIRSVGGMQIFGGRMPVKVD
jgi:hypothetical protein